MNLKSSMVMILLIFLIIIAVLFFKFSNPLLNFKQELISYLEETSNLQFEIETIKLWPLNRFVFKDLQIKRDGVLLASIGEVDVYYQISEMVHSPRDWRESIKHVALRGLQINYSSLEPEPLSWGLIDRITTAFSGVRVTVENGSISFKQADQQYNLVNLNTSIQYLKKGKVNLKLDTGVELRNFKYGSYQIDELHLDRLIGSLSIDGRNWQGKLKAPLDLTVLNPLFSGLEGIEKVQGKGEALIGFQGQGIELEDYRTKLLIENGEVLIDNYDHFTGRKFKKINGSLLVEKNSPYLIVNNFNFSYTENPYEFNGKLDFKNFSFSGHLTSDRINLSHPGFTGKVMDDRELSGSARLETDIRYRDNFFYVDMLNLSLNQGEEITLTGVYNNKSDIYSVNVRGREINTDLFNKYFLQKDEVDFGGKVNFNVNVSGSSFNISKLYALGKMEILSPQTGNNRFQTIKSDFWLAEGQLMLNNGVLTLANNRINFSGKLNLDSRQLAINFSGQEIDLALLERFNLDRIPEIAGKARLNGKVLAGFNNPEVIMDIQIGQLRIDDYQFSDLSTALTYQNRKFNFSGFRIRHRGILLKGAGSIDMKNDIPRLAARLKLDNIDLTNVNRLADQFLGKSYPLFGTFNKAVLTLQGHIDSPEIEGEIISDNLSFLLRDKYYTLDRAALNFSWKNNQPLIVRNLQLEKGITAITFEGEIDRGQDVNLDYSLNRLLLSDLELDSDLKGNLNLAGRITGKVNNPVITGELEALNLLYRDKPLEEMKGRVIYKNNCLWLEEVVWKLTEGNYNLSGRIDNIFNKPLFDLKLIVEDGNLVGLLEKTDINLPLRAPYNLRGQALIKGGGEDVYAEIDFKAIEGQNEANYIDLKGKIGRELKIDINAKNVRFKKTFVLNDNRLDVMAPFNFNGHLTGAFDSYDLTLNTTSRNLSINNAIIDNIKGRVLFKANEGFEFKQHLILNRGEALNIEGKIQVTDRPQLDKIGLSTERFPLTFVSQMLWPEIDIDGYFRGQLNISNSRDIYRYEGNIYLSAKDIDLSLPYKFNQFTGNIKFADRQIILADIEGEYGERPFNIQGNLKPFTGEQFWDLTVTGKNLPYKEGSINGQFDPDIRITGDFYNPLISGKLLTHDLIIGIPFEHPPKAPSGSLQFNPELDLILLPGEGVYVHNENMDIPVQGGSLNLNYDGKGLNFTGKVNSTHGSFDFYNNKFIMEAGYAEFKKFSDNIPSIHTRAYTYTGGVKVRVGITGKADNLIISFSSQPELPEKEILHLLVSKGGIGEIVTDKGGGVANFLGKELARFFQQTLQLEIAENIEKEIKDLLDLDRVEINTYELGWNKKITIYLGEQLTDKMYLEYSRTFSLDDSQSGDEIQNELSFYYYLNQSTHLEGSWLGDDDFRFNAETTIKF